jgi:hypothetical protein
MGYGENLERNGIPTVEEEELYSLLDKISGILDMAYEFTDDDEEKIYICEVEADLHDYLRKRGML